MFLKFFYACKSACRRTLAHKKESNYGLKKASDGLKCTRIQSSTIVSCTNFAVKFFIKNVDNLLIVSCTNFAVKFFIKNVDNLLNTSRKERQQSAPLPEI